MIGLSTLVGSQELEEIVNISQPGQKFNITIYCTEAIHIKVISSTINSIMPVDSKSQFYIMPLECYIFQSEFYSIPPRVL